jgi:hypothetical protein
MFAERFFFQEFAELAFALARSDGNTATLEVVEFNKVMRMEFAGKPWWPADDRFDMLTHTQTPTLNEAFINVVHVLRLNKDILTEETKAKYLFVLTRVAEVFGGVEEMEEFILERFKHTLDTL